MAGAALLALLSCGDATADPLKGERVGAEASNDLSGMSRPLVAQPRAAVSDLVWLTPGQVRRRFGLPPADSENVTEARLDGDALVTLVTFAGEGAAGGCSNGGSGWLADVRERGARSAVFVFRDGLLADLRPTDTLEGPSPVGEVVLRCYLDRRDAEFDPFTFMVVAPFLPFLAAQMATEKKQRQAATAALADLRLGAPPPGGLTAYAAAPPRQVSVTRAGGDAAEIVIAVKETGFRAQASIRDGRVVSLVAPPFTRCVLGPDQALRC